MKLACPECSAPIPARNVSFESGWAKCEACDEIIRLADVLPGFSLAPSHEAAVIERPYNARAVVERTAEELIVYVPAQGMRAATWGLLGFATFWLAFIAFWTAGALGVFAGGPAMPFQWGFAAFSIPFWCAGLGMVGGVLWLARGTCGIHIDRYEMLFRKKCLIWSRTRRVPVESIQYAHPYVAHSQDGQKNTVQVPWSVEIVYERGSFVVPADSEAEQKWLIHEINDFLRSVAA